MDAELGQLFPYRTLSMFISLVSILLFSLLARILFLRQILPPSCDVFQCFREKEIEKEDVNQMPFGTKYIPVSKEDDTNF